METDLLEDGTLLYKYTSASTVLKILQTQQIRLSTLSNLNDPFEMYHAKYIEFDEKEFKNQILDKQVAILFGDIVPTFPNAFSDNPLLKIIQNAFKMNPTQFGTRAEIKELILPAAEDFVNILKAESEKITKTIWDFAFDDYIIFSTSLVQSDVLMLTHYADNHKGVVIGFKCLRDLDNALCASRPIHYQDTPPALYNQEQYLKSAFGEELMDFTKYGRRLVYTKNNRWAYEKEMRLGFPAKNIDQEGYGHINISPLEIDSISFGCRITEVDKKLIIDQLELNFPHSKKFNLVENRVENTFTPIAF
jgi:hypothetical protein